MRANISAALLLLFACDREPGGEEDGNPPTETTGGQDTTLSSCVTPTLGPIVEIDSVGVEHGYVNKVEIADYACSVAEVNGREIRADCEDAVSFSVKLGDANVDPSELGLVGLDMSIAYHVWCPVDCVAAGWFAVRDSGGRLVLGGADHAAGTSPTPAFFAPLEFDIEGDPSCLVELNRPGKFEELFT